MAVMQLFLNANCPKTPRKKKKEEDEKESASFFISKCCS